MTIQSPLPAVGQPNATTFYPGASIPPHYRAAMEVDPRRLRRQLRFGTGVLIVGLIGAIGILAFLVVGPELKEPKIILFWMFVLLAAVALFVTAALSLSSAFLIAWSSQRLEMIRQTNARCETEVELARHAKLAATCRQFVGEEGMTWSAEQARQLIAAGLQDIDPDAVESAVPHYVH